MKPFFGATTHVLPFESLEPQSFERLCLWLVVAEGYIEVAHYGLRGSDSGRDILAVRRSPETKELFYFQCKHVASASFETLRGEIDKIMSLSKEVPGAKPDAIVFILSCAISARSRDRVADYVGSYGIGVEIWARTELDYRVKRHPAILREFFHQPTEDPFDAHLERLRLYVDSELDRTVLDNSRTLEIATIAECKPERQVPAAYIPSRPSLRDSDGDPNREAVRKFARFADAFEQCGQRVVLVGEAGSGKTTTLLQFARHCIERRRTNRFAPLPVYAPVRTWDGNAPLFELVGVGHAAG